MEVPLLVVLHSEILFPSSLATFLSLSVAVSRLVSVRLTPYCTRNSTCSLNYMLLYASSRSTATAFVPSLQSFVGIVCESACFFPSGFPALYPPWFGGSTCIPSRILEFSASSQSLVSPD